MAKFMVYTGMRTDPGTQVIECDNAKIISGGDLFLYNNRLHDNEYFEAMVAGFAAGYWFRVGEVEADGGA